MDSSSGEDEKKVIVPGAVAVMDHQESKTANDDDDEQEARVIPETPKENPFHRVIENDHIVRGEFTIASRWTPAKKEVSLYPVLRAKMSITCGKCGKNEFVHVYDADAINQFASTFGSSDLTSIKMPFATKYYNENASWHLADSHWCFDCKGTKLYIPSLPQFQNGFKGEFFGFSEPLDQICDLKKMAEYTVQIQPNLRRFVSYKQAKEYEEFLQRSTSSQQQQQEDSSMTSSSLTMIAQPRD